jgi:hypothetical protein
MKLRIYESVGFGTEDSERPRLKLTLIFHNSQNTDKAKDIGNIPRVCSEQLLRVRSVDQMEVHFHSSET